jgi:hypothetical protein
MTDATDEARFKAEAAAGDEASRIINNPVFKAAVDKLNAQILQHFYNCPVGEEGDQQRLFAQAQYVLLVRLVKNLKLIMSGGDLAQQDVIVLADAREAEKKKTRRR